MTDLIQLPRSALTDDLWKNNGAALRVYIYLARQSENGEVNTSVARICNATGLTERQVRNILTEFETSSKTSSKRSSKGSSITLCGISNNNTLGSSKTSSKRSSKNQVKFIPPTREEAQEYIDKMGFHWGNADLFIDFNKQKGWRLSDGKPMRDWKAAMRNWENRWKQKYENRTAKSTNGDKYAPRRGTNIGNLKESDYGGSF